MTHQELQRIRDWADAKITTGNEPPWSWFLYMKLREDLDQVIASIAVSVIKTESSPQSELHSGNGPRLVVSNVRQDGAQPHQQVVETLLPT